MGGTDCLALGLSIIITGWQSFGVIPEKLYNDILLVTDLGLLATYWLFLYYCRGLVLQFGQVDATLFNISGATFFLYAIWDTAALAGRDTSALATAAHLARFAWITFVVGIIFFGLGVFSSASILGNPAEGWVLRVVGFSLWVGIIVWWQVSRFVAALGDTHDGPR